jgi:hypothetical protein
MTSRRAPRAPPPGNDYVLRHTVERRCPVRGYDGFAVSNNAVAVHQDRLHALTRAGHVPAFYDLERITS